MLTNADSGLTEAAPHRSLEVDGRAYRQQAADALALVSALQVENATLRALLSEVGIPYSCADEMCPKLQCNLGRRIRAALGLSDGGT